MRDSLSSKTGHHGFCYHMHTAQLQNQRQIFSDLFQPLIEVILALRVFDPFVSKVFLWIYGIFHFLDRFAALWIKLIEYVLIHMYKNRLQGFGNRTFSLICFCCKGCDDDGDGFIFISGKHDVPVSLENLHGPLQWSFVGLIFRNRSYRFRQQHHFLPISCCCPLNKPDPISKRITLHPVFG